MATSPKTKLPDITKLTAAQILAIDENEPERVFPGNETEMKVTFRRLVRRWHPDYAKNPRANDVMSHLGKLRDAAEQRLARGTWVEPDTARFNTKDGRSFRMHYAKKFAFELGTTYIGRQTLAFQLDHGNEDLAQRAEVTLKSLPFPNAQMKDEFKRYLPDVKQSLETTNGPALILNRDVELIRARDVLDYSGGRVEPKQVAWIINSLLNLKCYLDFAGLTHNDISLDTYYISPQLHFGALLGGWWYAAKAGQSLAALPTRSAELAPREVLRCKKADPRLDQLLIRAMGCELLGDPLGSRLTTMTDVPKPLANWLRMPGPANAVEDYKTYVDQVMPGSFGPRRFVKWDVSPKAIYA